jgi:hypothetical protein
LRLPQVLQTGASVTTYIVSEGDWDIHEHYQGPSLWRAGLALAKARRDARRCWMGGLGHFWVHRMGEEDALDLDSPETPEEEFLSRCFELGLAARSGDYARVRHDEVTCRAVLRVLARGGNITGEAWATLEKRGYAARIGFNTPSLTRKGWDAFEAAK